MISNITKHANVAGEGIIGTNIEVLMMEKEEEILESPKSYKIISDLNIWITCIGSTCHTIYSNNRMTNAFDTKK